MTGGEKYWQIEGGLMKIAYINEEEAGYSLVHGIGTVSEVVLWALKIFG